MLSFNFLWAPFGNYEFGFYFFGKIPAQRIEAGSIPLKY
ncbi:hypothetical protein LEP1GSC055_2516 [Leptospira borgpetersenii str. Brem 307]|uniref:Uncharacterized protein n=1 Tax=Leptospira borgpetersenii str. Brem 328 TaxID=1049780 RepID=A0ABC9SLD8_LEPBO|nr:hypothetical protein LEP1GSC055_2516 [Leptospira borgpetersenii str. Brem 307]EMN18634.1 hypothetical protein LEP1GSC056_2157 [Leptospira borgpetersenii str. Brem 328]